MYLVLEEEFCMMARSKGVRRGTTMASLSLMPSVDGVSVAVVAGRW